MKLSQNPTSNREAMRRADVQRAIDYVHANDDYSSVQDEIEQAFTNFWGRPPNADDDPWSDLCAAIGNDDTADDHADMWQD